MRIGIMTFPNSVSFGATLQMYALYKTVEKLGACPEILNYQNPYMKAEHHTRAIRETSTIKKRMRLAARKAIHWKQVLGFRHFEKKMHMYPDKPVDNADLLPLLGQRYDGVICGSDQVWNPQITGEDISYFLDFCGQGTKRIAYAPSFGITELPESFRTRIAEELNRFSAISAREEEGAQILRDILGREVPLVLDPTFLLDQDDWIKLEQWHPAAEEDYILYFTVFSSRSLMDFCRELADKSTKKIVVVGGNALRQLRNRDKRIEYAWDLNPGQWLYLIHHASCVVTNSFHGTAFSIHYQKDFYVEPAPSANSRLAQIVRTSGLEDRVVGNRKADPERHIDYSEVYERFASLKAQSLSYLKEYIQ